MYPKQPSTTYPKRQKQNRTRLQHPLLRPRLLAVRPQQAPPPPRLPTHPAGRPLLPLPESPPRYPLPLR